MDKFCRRHKKPQKQRHLHIETAIIWQVLPAFRRIQTRDDLLTKEAEKWIIEWLTEQKKQGLAYPTINNARSALEGSYSMNVLVLNWDKITRYLPEADKKVEDSAYIRDEIVKLLYVVKLRKRAIILTL